MKKGTVKRLVALLCVAVLVFCDVGSVLAETSVNPPAVDTEQEEVIPPEVPEEETPEVPEEEIPEVPEEEIPEVPEEEIPEVPEEEIPEVPEEETPEVPETPGEGITDPDHTHIYTEIITKEPSTTEKGEKTFTCECGDTYTEEIEALPLAKSHVIHLNPIDEGMEVGWREVEGATYYKLYRKEAYADLSTMVEIATVEGSTCIYFDETVVPNTDYQWAVQAFNDVSAGEIDLNEWSYWSDNYYYISRPVIQGEQVEAGIRLYWDAVPGAKRYTIHTLNEDLTWKYQESVKTTEALLWGPEFGETVTYSVRAIYATRDYESASAYSEPVTIDVNKVFPSEITKITSTGYKQLRISLKYVAAAEKYEIFRATSKNGEYKLVKTITECADVTDKNLTPNKTYYYKVRTVIGDQASEFSAVKSGTPRVLKPTMKSTANATGTSIKVSWSKPAGVTGYYVYRKKGSGSWSKIATITKAATTSYTDKKATGKYSYSVIAYKKVDGKTYQSLRSNAIQASILKKTSSFTVNQKGTKCAVTVKWNKVSNATGYQVYRKTGKNGSWSLVKTTGSGVTSYSQNMSTGTTLYFKVRAIRKIDGTTTYAPYSAEKNICFSNPKFNFEFNTSYGSSVRTIKLTIYNNSKLPMRFYSADAVIADENKESNNRLLQLVDSKGKNINYSDVKAGAKKTLTFKVVGKTTKYNQNSIIGVVFRFDGLKYLFATYAGSPYGEYVLLEN